MSQSDKAALYQELKESGVNFDRHYREYTTDELRNAVTSLRMRQAEEGAGGDGPELELPDDAEQQHDLTSNLKGQFPPEPDISGVPVSSAPKMQEPVERPAPEPEPAQARVPVAHRNEGEMAGQRVSSNIDALTPIRVDPETGHVWFQEEVRKPSFAQPRGRRIVKYTDPGTVQAQVKTAEGVEIFEVPGEGPGRPAEARVTLPSYQVGIYKDRRFPFKIHVYNEQRGFDLFEVANYYGGIELVPTEIKRIYVANVLCFDMRTTIRAITTEYRRLQLAGVIEN